MALDETPDVPVTIGDGELVIAAGKLTDAITALGADAGQQFVDQAALIRRTQRTQRALIIGLIFEVLILVGFAFGGLAIAHSQNRINALTTRLDVAQTTTRQKSLCPLYQLILAAKTPQGRAAAPDKAQYDFAFMVIQQGYDALNCASFTTTGATNTP